MPFSTALNNELLDHVFGGAAYSAPATVYLAASTSTPTAAGANVTEPAGNGYARKAVTANSTNFPAASGGALSNGVAMAFATATGGAWGLITHIAIYDAATDGTFLGYGALSASKQIDAGDTLNLKIGDLDIQMT